MPPSSSGLVAASDAVVDPGEPIEEELPPPVFLRQSVLSCWFALCSTRQPLSTLQSWFFAAAQLSLAPPTAEKVSASRDAVASAWPSLIFEAFQLIPTEAWKRSEALSSSPSLVCPPFITLSDAMTLPSPNVFTIFSRLARQYRSALSLFWDTTSASSFSSIKATTTDIRTLISACVLSAEPHLVLEGLRIIEEWSLRSTVTSAPVTSVPVNTSSASSSSSPLKKNTPVPNVAADDDTSSSSLGDLTHPLDQTSFFALSGALSLCVHIFPALFEFALSEAAAPSSFALTVLTSIRAKIITIIGNIPFLAWMEVGSKDPQALDALVALLIAGTSDKAAVVRSAAVKSLGSPSLCLALYELFHGRAPEPSMLCRNVAPAASLGLFATSLPQAIILASQSYLSMLLEAVLPLSAEHEKVVAVRTKAMCAVANFAQLPLLIRQLRLQQHAEDSTMDQADQILATFFESDLMLLIDTLLASATETENDKVLAHSVRGLGNLAHWLPWRALNILSNTPPALSALLKQSPRMDTSPTSSPWSIWVGAVQRLGLIVAAVHVAPKARWNAAYAIGNALSHKNFVLIPAQDDFPWMICDDLWRQMLSAVSQADNFKIGINCALALQIPENRRLFSDSFIQICTTLLECLRGFEEHNVKDFIEFQARCL
jgi:hypothetical protein